MQLLLSALTAPAFAATNLPAAIGRCLEVRGDIRFGASHDEALHALNDMEQKIAHGLPRDQRRHFLSQFHEEILSELHPKAIPDELNAVYNDTLPDELWVKRYIGVLIDHMQESAALMWQERSGALLQQADRLNVRDLLPGKYIAPLKKLERSRDYLQYETEREDQLRAMTGIAEWGAAFSRENPIHDQLIIDLQDAWKTDATRIAYGRLTTILRRVRRYLKEINPSPQHKMDLVFKSMAEEGLPMKGDTEHILRVTATKSLAEHIRDGEATCFIATIVALAIAYEFQWPVYAVPLTNHIILRWDDGRGTRFNVDMGIVAPDSTYHEWPRRLSPYSIQRGISLSIMGRNELFGDMLAWAAVRRRAQKEPHRAVVLLEASFKLYDLNTSAHINRAGLYYERKDWERAKAHYKKVTVLDPNYTPAYAKLGFIHYKLGEWQKTVDAFDAYLHLDPDTATAHRVRGAAYRELGQLNKAQSDLDRALELKPSGTMVRAWIHYERARLFLVLQEFDKAEAEINSAIALGTQDRDFYLTRASVYLRQRKFLSGLWEVFSSLFRRPEA